MKKKLLSLVTVVTITATGISGYISTLPNPTEVQTNLANTTNTIAIAGATSIFGMLDDQNKDKDGQE